MQAFLGFVVAAFFRPTDLVFVRHAETQANATGHYNAKTLNVFSAKGMEEVQALTANLLKQRKFDLILVSPSPRVLRTIAPYLRLSHQQAVVWPLLYECCTSRRPKDAHPTAFGLGGRVTIPKDLTPLFVVQSKMARLPVASDYNSGLAQVKESLGEFRSRYAGQRVLLVGHSGQGGQFLHLLVGGWRKVDNARPMEFRLP